MNGAPVDPPAAPTFLRQQVEALHGAAWGWSLACCAGDAEVATDVLQDSYAKVLDGKAEFAGRARFKTWLFGVIRRTASEHRRRHLLRRLGLARYTESGLVAGRPTPVDPVEVGERAAALARCLSGLARRQHQVLHLVFYEELSLRESALAMGVSLGAASRHYHRGKNNLRCCLEREGVNRDE